MEQIPSKWTHLRRRICGKKYRRPEVVRESSACRPNVVRASSQSRHGVIILDPLNKSNTLILHVFGLKRLRKCRHLSSFRKRRGKAGVTDRLGVDQRARTGTKNNQAANCAYKTGRIKPRAPSMSGRAGKLRRRFASQYSDTHRSRFTMSKSADCIRTNIEHLREKSREPTARFRAIA